MTGGSAVGAAQAQTYTVAPGSLLALDGSTVLGGFTCRSDQPKGTAELRPNSPAETRIAATLAAPVGSFDCGNGGMNRDLARALKGDEHPSIRFTLDRVGPMGQAGADGWTPVHAWGTLSLAGAQQAVRVEAMGRPEGDRMRLRGQHQLHMTDFDVRPPSGPLGLVRARDEITVRFELVVRPSTR
jgi:hypothetical protein